MSIQGRREDWDYEWGLPHGEARAFIAFVNTAAALVMSRTGKTRKQAIDAIARDRPVAEVRDILAWLHEHPEAYLP